VRDGKFAGRVIVSEAIDKRNGTYPQKQPGLYMQRIRIPGGRITAAQWRVLAAVTEAYCEGAPLHLTTRQDVELHDVPGDSVPAVRARLEEADLHTVGACGDTIRNITLCPTCDLKPAGVDLAAGVGALHAYLISLPFYDALPRKFKISFSVCGQTCAQPYVNDLGFVLRTDGRFTVIGAGSLGPRPNLGIVLRQRIELDEVAAYCAAVLEFFAEHGDRNNRRKARLRHVRERMGDEAFVSAIEQRFASWRNGGPFPVLVMRRTERVLPFAERLCPPLGDLTVAQARDLADVMDGQGLACRIGLHQEIFLRGAQPIRPAPSLADLSGRPAVVCCPGSRSCPQGLVDTQGLARRILSSDWAEGLADRCVHISGCPNHCAHTAVARMGVSGRRRTIEGATQEAFELFLEGGEGCSQVLSQKGRIVDADQFLERLKQWADSPNAAPRVPAQSTSAQEERT